MINEGLDSDFFKRQYPRLKPMTYEEYRNAPKRAADDHRLDGVDPDGGGA